VALGRPDGAIEPFEFHGCDCGVASFKGQPPWELHTAGDEQHPAHPAQRRR